MGGHSGDEVSCYLIAMRDLVRAAVVLVIAATSCKRTEPQPRDPPATVGSAGSAVASGAGSGSGSGSGAPVDAATTAACTAAMAKATSAAPLTWIHDDYAGALACARAKHLPVVLDLWAPWCHTCLSMQSTVFRDASFGADASKFVFAALDTDRPENEGPVGKFPLSAWPTFYVVGADEAVLARFVGSASVAQFHAFMAAGATAAAGGITGPEANLLASERATADGDLEGADAELTAALNGAPADWSRRPDVLVSLIGTKERRKDIEGCIVLAEKSIDQTGTAASASDFLYTAMECAIAAMEAAPADQAVTARVTALRQRAVARWQALVDDAAAPLSVDDRSDALANLRETLDVLGTHDLAAATAERQRKLLDDTAAAAATPLAAMTYIWPRCEVYAYLKTPLALVPSLVSLAQQLPAEYDPPARIGWLYWKGGELREAATWTEQAIHMVYGPRKARLLGQRADIAHDAKDAAAERTYRAQVVALWESMPAGQANPDALSKARATLETLTAGAPR